MADATSLEFAPPDDESQTDRLAALLDLHGLAVIGADHAGRIVGWSPGAVRLFGYRRADALRRTLPDLFTDQAAAEVRAWLDGLRDRRIDSGGPPLEWEARQADGRTFSVRVTINPTAAGVDLLVAAPSVGGAVLRSESFLRAVYDASDEMMILTDLEGRIVWSNTAWYRGLGYDPASRRTPFENIHDRDLDRVLSAWTDLKSGRGEFRDVAYRYRKGDGSQVWLETTILPIPGQPYCYVRSRNITQKRLLEEAAERRARYLEATIGVAALAAGPTPDAGLIAAYLRERLGLAAAGVWIDSGAASGCGRSASLPRAGSVDRAGLGQALADLAARGGGTTGDATDAAAGAVVALVDSGGRPRGALVLGLRSEATEEPVLACNLAATLSLALERQEYMSGLAREAAAESMRADLGAALLSCCREQDALALALEFFERQYGLQITVALVGGPDRLQPVLARVEGRPAVITGVVLAAGPQLAALLVDGGPPAARIAGGGPVCRGVCAEGCAAAAAAAIRALVSPADGGGERIALRIPGVGVVCGLAPRPPGDQDLQANAIVLDAVAAVVKQLRTEEARRRALRRTEQVHQLEIEVRRLPVGRPAEKLRAIAAGLAAMTAADRVAILLRDEEDRRSLRPAAVATGPGSPRLRRSLRRLASELARDAFESGEAVFVAAASRWAGIESLPGRLRPLAPPGTVVPPLYAGPIRGGGGQPTGAFCLLGREPLDETDLVVFHDIAALISGTVKDESLYRRQKELATRDELTRLYNRRYFLRRAAEWFRIARRYGKPFAIVLLDADRFKSVNDTYGHDCGDQVLIQLSRTITGAVREVDVAARYGGEEFIVLLPETGGEGALRTAQRIREAVEDRLFECGEQRLRLTVSCGVATVGESTGDLDGEPYGVQWVDNRLHARLPSGAAVALGASLAEAADRGRLHAAVAAARGLGERQREHLETLAFKAASLEGMISIADARLYRSKSAGGNRVTDGS